MLNERNTLLEDDGIEEEILVEEECSVAQAVWGDIQGNIENQTDLQNALDAKQDSLTEAQLNAVNSGITSEKVTTYDGYADQIASKANQSALNAETIARGKADMALGTRIDNEALARQSADNGLQTQIDAITSKSDVVDVVANYAALQAYDTSTLGNNDVVKVLDDETHEDALTYYRWSTTTQTWTYIGQEAPYYSKGQMDVMLQGKQDTLTAGANIQIENGTISATDTTYTAGNGLNLNGTEFSADTDVLATKSDLDSYYTKTETDTKLAPKLETEVVSALPATGDSSKLYLTPKAHTTQTATGNPVTATVAEKAGKFESFQLDGDTFQQSYNGSNLINMPIVSDSKNGVTWVVNSDGSITLNGTATANVSIRANNASIPAVAGETYTLSATGLQKIVNFGYKNSNSGADIFVVTSGSPVKTEQVTAEMLTSANRLDMFITSGSSFNNQRVTLQLEKGSTASPYEPYVGGQPSPSPDYPQPIQTVTGEQTVTVIGKNLFNKNAVTNGGYIDTNGEVVAWDTFGYSEYIRVIGGQTYSYSGTANNVGYSAKAAWYDSNKNFISYFSFGTSGQVTAPATAKFLRTSVRIASPSGLDTYQLELGSTITTYEAYKATNYPISLGSIELNGLGDDGNGNPLYKDYIYPDGDTWKVHKATSKATIDSLTDGESSSIDTTLTNTTRVKIDKCLGEQASYAGRETPVCNEFVYKLIWNSDESGFYLDVGSDQSKNGIVFRGSKNVIGTTNTAIEGWLNSEPITVYYAIATATDTVITDTTLIAQLEAIRTASLATGTSTIANNATGSNLAGDMEIGYYGCNPTNRYDKWIWLDFDNSYEQLNNPEPNATLSSTRSLSTTTEQTTPTRSVETVSLKKGASEPVVEKTEEAVKEEYTEPVVEESETKEEPEIKEEPEEEISEQVESEKEKIKEEKTDSEEPVEERKEEGK